MIDLSLFVFAPLIALLVEVGVAGYAWALARVAARETPEPYDAEREGWCL